MPSNSEEPGIVSSTAKTTTATADTTTQGEISGAAQQPPPEPNFTDLIRACQRGDLNTAKELISQGDATAQDAMDDGTTPLHWAAINNRMSVCRFLIDSGAEVDVKGGELQATPLHWASRSGLVYIVHMLIQRGADPLRTDAQGFNALHLAVHSSNVLLVIYLLHQGLPVDTVDPAGRTALHWSAYQGDALSVDCLLNWGAGAKIGDSLGFTPLHWSVVRGDRVCMKRLIEEGSDVFAKNNDGKNTQTMATEMHTMPTWLAALEEAGRLPNGSPRVRRLNKKQVDLVMFFVPFLVIPLIVLLLESLVFYISIPLSLVLIFVSMQLCKKYVLPNAYFGGHNVTMKSPFLAGVFAGSCFWTVVRYLAIVLPATVLVAPWVNLLFTLVFGTVLYAFFRAMLMDPGYVPRLSGITEQKKVIEELLDRGEFDTKHFCVMTYIRKPLRSKYDKSSKRVVAKFDHYCPWVNNSVGVRNHRMFLIYIVGLLVGLPLMDYLYFGIYAAELPQAECLYAPDFMCSALTYDSFSTQFVFWDSMQLVWVTFLVFVQLVQIGRALTTDEAANLHRMHTGTQDFSSLPQDHHAVAATASTAGESLAFAASRKKPRWYSSMLRLLGIDQFINTAQDLGSRDHKSTSPADYGVMTNCADFWCPPGDSWNLLKVHEDGHGALNRQPVDYYSLYEYPAKSRGGSHTYEMVEQV